MGHHNIVEHGTPTRIDTYRNNWGVLDRVFLTLDHGLLRLIGWTIMYVIRTTMPGLPGMFRNRCWLSDQALEFLLAQSYLF